MKMASLFDGSGGFPLAAALNGIEPIWASEIEPFPIRVTTKRFPNMKHYGDVSKINGAEVEPVDIITFGSPCQDLSLAGKRKGIDGERSGLFFQAVRIIKEMRRATNNEYPKYIIWENVPGAFSSNNGEDFRAVIEGILGIEGTGLSVPRCEKWLGAGFVLGDKISIAWRVLDAQFWGVPQRRKRIYLVADFTGGGAGEILFKQECLYGYSPQSRDERQGTATDSKEGSEATSIENHPNDSRVKLGGRTVQSLTSRMGTGGGNVPLCMERMQLGWGGYKPDLNCEFSQPTDAGQRRSRSGDSRSGSSEHQFDGGGGINHNLFESGSAASTERSDGRGLLQPKSHREQEHDD